MMRSTIFVISMMAEILTPPPPAYPPPFSNEEQTWAYVLDFLSPLAIVRGCWSASREYHAHAVASLRARFGWRPDDCHAEVDGGGSSIT